MILEHARNAFNERGVMNVGIREIARDLELSPGNVSYHFPTKGALIAALVRDIHRDNNAAIAAPDGRLDFSDVDAIIRAIMRRDLENRWLLLDYVGLLVAVPELRALHDPMQRGREARVAIVVDRLIEARLLDGKLARGALARLRLQVLTQIFFWLPSAFVAAPDRDPADSLDAHARAALALLLPYCTSAGRRQLEVVLRKSR
jgi:AcrR family transcriptional regulator